MGNRTKALPPANRHVVALDAEAWAALDKVVAHYTARIPKGARLTKASILRSIIEAEAKRLESRG